jgi:hypothetical protein
MAKPKRPRDVNQLAKLIVDLSTGDATERKESVRAKSGRAGGVKGGKTRMAQLSDEDRAKLAQKAAQARWKKAAPARKGAAKPS